MFRQRLYKQHISYIILAGLMVVFLYSHSPNIEYDTPSYIAFSAIRPPLYPIYIWLFKWAGIYQYTLIMWSQGLWLFIALLFARTWLKAKLFIPDFLIAMVCALVILTIAFHFQVWYIQSEGLAFPLFIVGFFLTIDCFQQFSLRKITYLAIVISLLLLTRLQFYYFYAIFALLCVHYVWQGIKSQSILLAGAILLSSILLTTLIDKSYHYFKHGFFASAPYSGQMLMVQTLFLAKENAFNDMLDPMQKSTLQKMLAERDRQQLNEDGALAVLKPSALHYAYLTYSRNYLGLLQIINAAFANDLNALGHEDFAKNAVIMDMNKTLIMHDVKKHSYFFAWKFIECVGNLPLLLFYAILLLALPLHVYQRKTSALNIGSIFVSLIAMITFGNAAMIAVCNPALPVYFCYSQFMFYCLAIFLISKTLQGSS